MTNEKLQMRNERGRERGKRKEDKKEKKTEKGKKTKEERGKRRTRKRRRQRKGCIPASLYMKMIDSISANYRNNNCQCFINETNYLS